MKKLSKGIFCLVFAFFSVLGLTACSIEDVKNNATAALESSTGVVAVEYSQTLARDLFSVVVCNLNKMSYSMTDEYTRYNSNHYIESYQSMKSITYNKADSTIFVFDDIIANVNESQVSYNGKHIVAKLKDTVNNIDKYYWLQNYVSDQEQPDIVKCYEDNVNIGVGPAGFVHLLPYITSGMCYDDGYSYINVEYIQSNIKQLASFKIKDGLLLEATVNLVDLTTQKLDIFEKITFNYKDLPEAPIIPETLQELIADGYIVGNACEIINDKYQQ